MSKKEKQERDENGAAVMCIVWTLVFGIGCFLENAVGWTIVIAVTALCAMYIKYDLERDRKERQQELKQEQFRERLKEAEKY